MRPGPVASAVRGGLSRRRVQTVVIAVVLLVSTGASVLALALLVDSNAPFDHAFAGQHGAHVTVTVDAARATVAELAATRRLTQVTAMAGPFAEATITAEVVRQAGTPAPGALSGPSGPSDPSDPSGPGAPPGPAAAGGQGAQAGPDGQGAAAGNGQAPTVTVAGRSGPGGPVDDITLLSGHWPRRPGQIVLAGLSASGPPLAVPGAQIMVTGVPGRPRLTVVGIASSVTGSADGWVLPAEIARLRPPGGPASAQLLYRFRAAGSASAVRSDVAAVTAALPAGTVTGAQSYLAVKARETSGIAPYVPFVVAFGVIGLVLSVLIVANVVSGAVVAGYRRIGILKSIGFTPGQVVTAYTGQVSGPAAVGCAGGVALGNLLAVPLLRRTASVYQVGTLRVPAWVDVTVPAAMCCLVAIAAVLPALRAGRLSAVQAIAIGRAPRVGRGYAAHRLLARIRLPRPVTIGLAAPFTRPARAAVTLTAIGLGAIAVTFAVGLGASLDRVAVGLSHSAAEPVQIGVPPAGSSSAQAAQRRTVVAALRAQPGTLHYVAQADLLASVPGLTGKQVAVTAFQGGAGWTGYGMISGHWYAGPGQADVAPGFLTATGAAVGDRVTIIVNGRRIPVRIVGEIFETDNQGLDLLTDWQTMAGAVPGLAPDMYDVGLRPGVSASAYADALSSRLGSGYGLGGTGTSPFLLVLIGLISTLTLLIAVVAGLGVLNTVVLHTRERVHDLGVFKAVGMTPRQAIAMVVCWVAGTGLVAGLLAVPAGVALHRYVLPQMAAAAGLGLPASYLDVYGGWQLAALALAGVVIAAAGALLPAGWAAGIRTASALRAE